MIIIVIIIIIVAGDVGRDLAARGQLDAADLQINIMTNILQHILQTCASEGI